MMVLKATVRITYFSQEVQYQLAFIWDYHWMQPL